MQEAFQPLAYVSYSGWHHERLPCGGEHLPAEACILGARSAEGGSALIYSWSIISDFGRMWLDLARDWNSNI